MTERALGFHMNQRHGERMLLETVRDRDERWQRSTYCHGCSLELGSDAALLIHVYFAHDGNWNKVDTPPTLLIREEPS
jgi:hypothetical protein